MNDITTHQPVRFRRARPLIFSLIAISFAFIPVPSAPAQDKAQDKQSADKGPKYSEAEVKAAKKVEAADAAASLQAGTEFLKKYSKSGLRPQVARVVAVKIDETADPAQRIALFEKYFAQFNDPAEYNAYTPAYIDAYIKANRLDDAFRLASTYVGKNPNDVVLLTRMAVIGVGQAQRNNMNFVQPSQQYGTKAIELIESNQKPANVSEAQWGELRTKGLGQLYQAMAVLAMGSGDAAGAKAKLEKSASLNSSDPFTFALMGNMINDDYQKLAQQYNATPAGAGKEEMLKKSQAKLDEIIEAYAHALALSEAKPEFKGMHDQIQQALEPYYKFRHNNSTDGMQQLIDKYKQPASATTTTTTVAAPAQ